MKDHTNHIRKSPGLIRYYYTMWKIKQCIRKSMEYAADTGRSWKSKSTKHLKSVNYQWKASRNLKRNSKVQ